MIIIKKILETSRMWTGLLDETFVYRALRFISHRLALI